ncbi:MAG: cytochrome P450 [Pseudomonadales bacterium]|jgi:cytochrome P450|nr:cytochrome P450 [Gammaproteobacteria bacterium]MBP6050769.1 cytochrome P450 [Pseudomonadales bacterium]MBK6584442.1 cytochrome P450 [Gammaproteobacteria bacterium]MBK7520901.1 cytochrome P450 [Gammaproteobacteria bacterium]MBK8309078.1 cytochrome P450 [Gammaproteobacteria bacterium]
MTAAPAPLPVFDLRQLDDDYYANPFPVYAALREHAPVYRCPDGSFFLSRHDDINSVYRNAKLFSSDKRTQFEPVFGADAPLYRHHTASLVFNDPPLHTHVRKAFGNALSPKMIVAMEPGLMRLVDDLLDGIAQRREFDLIADYAAAIPVEIIGNLLRIPPDERAPLRRWSLAILGALEVGLSAQQIALGNRCVEEMLEFLAEFVERRRHHLSNDEDDILARLIRWESDGYRLSETELYHQCIFLLNAGHETTSNLIGNGIHLLLTHPRELARLRAEPALIESAVEEILRYESSNQLGNRTAREDTAIRGVAIPKGSILTLCIGAANRDPQVFSDPDRFDIARDPNPHLAFGAGIHTCAGLNVARLEGRVAIARIFERFPELRLSGEPVRSRRARFRGFDSLPLAIS